MFLGISKMFHKFSHILIFLDNNLKCIPEGDPTGRVLLLEAFAGPAQGPRVDVPPSAAVAAVEFRDKLDII